MIPGAFVVAGGSSGIGAEIASAITSVGRRVGVVTHRKGAPPNLPPTTRTELVDWVRADLRSTLETSSAVLAWADGIGGAVDGLVLSAVSYGRGGRHSLQ